MVNKFIDFALGKSSSESPLPYVEETFDEFNEFISYILSEEDTVLFEAGKNIEEIYINLVENHDFLFDYLHLNTSLDYTSKIILEDFKLLMPLHVHSNVEFFRFDKNSQKIYLDRLRKIVFIRSFIRDEYKEREDEIYGSLDKILETLSSSVKRTLESPPIMIETSNTECEVN